MVKKNIWLWLVLPTFATLAILLIWQFGFREEMRRTASHGIDVALAQGKIADPVIANTSSCIQLPIQTGEGDFTPLDNALKCVVAKYRNAADRQDKEKALALDTELRELVYAVQSIQNREAWKTFWQSKEQSRYQYMTTIGIRIDDVGMRYDGGLRYDTILEARTGALFMFESFKPRFEQIRADYLAIPKAQEITNIEALYKLDEQLEKLIVETNSVLDISTPFPNYPEIGVYLDGQIYYSGAIRQVADKLLPPQGFVDPKTGNRIGVKGDRYSKLKGKLDEIYQAHKSLRQAPEDAEKLYELSVEIGKVVEEIHKTYPFNRSQVFWEKKYASLGMYIGHYSDQLDYGGKLVVDSYRLNPESRYSETTLVAAISGGGDMSELNGVPNVDLAQTYMKKYPNGKHLEKVYSILATFYQNLYEELLPGDESASIVDCYKEHLAVHPEDKDRETVRNKAIGYYKKLLTFEQSAAEGYKKALSNLEYKRDGNRRYWCTD